MCGDDGKRSYGILDIGRVNCGGRVPSGGNQVKHDNKSKSNKQNKVVDKQ